MAVVAAILELRTHYRERAAKTLGVLPPFSPILNQLLADLGKENVSYAKLSDLIEKDTVIAGNVLRLVNSGMYGRRGVINSVRSAIAVLGLNKLRNTVLGLSVSRMWSQLKIAEGFSSKRLNLHSVATAVLADQLAGALPAHYPEGAFLAGLFHDLGKMLIAVGMSEEYGHILYRYRVSERSHRECEHEILGLTHEELSAVAVANWNLPEPIQTAVLLHHRPENDSCVPGTSEHIPLSQILAAANHHVNVIGISVEQELRECDLDSKFTIDSFGLTPERRQTVLADFDTEFKAITGFFH
jgi:HD-like signal output (HDOD) protein